MISQTPLVIYWFRRDLRLTDNAGLFHALTCNVPVLPLFILDDGILDQLDHHTEKRIGFIVEALKQLNTALVERGTSLRIVRGHPVDIFSDLMSKYQLKGVYANEDYEPGAMARDHAVTALLKTKEIPFFTFKDHVIFAREQLMTGNDKPYTVFTPYSVKWKATLQEVDLKAYPSESIRDNWVLQDVRAVPDAKDLGFESSQLLFWEPFVDRSVVAKYDETRNFPAIDGTTLIGPHLRFGTISIRECVRIALEGNKIWLNQLIWRDFFIQVLWHFPGVVDHSFREKFDRIEWLNNEQEFDRWKNGTTGIPIVDAGMRQLNQTGTMHNRVRMIVASFLTKHLLIDWRWGEAYFASKLLDYELAANNGNWQWAAGSGVDPSPWFRIFNPVLQSRKFDPTNEYVKRWVPEAGTAGYVSPMIDLDFGRNRCQEVFKRALRE